ncbi:hypothetical protein ACX3YG_14425 [Pseudomonas wadenswilerensis]
MSTVIVSADDLKARENYRESLDFGENSGRELLDILGDYSFPDTKMVPCGIKGCRTPHMRGFLVLTTDGLETNIGNVCGKKHLGENFKFKRAEFVQRQNEKRNLFLIAEIKEKIETLRPTLDDLYLRASSLVKLKMASKQAHTQLIRKVIERAKLNQAALSGSVAMTKDEARRQHFHEAEADEDGITEPFESWFARRRPTKVVQVASLEGLLFWQYELHEIFRKDILNFVSELDQLKESDLVSLSSASQRRYARWGQGLDKKLTEVTAVIYSGENFFTVENIDNLKFLEIELDKNSRATVRYAIEVIKKAIKKP